MRTHPIATRLLILFTSGCVCGLVATAPNGAVSKSQFGLAMQSPSPTPRPLNGSLPAVSPDAWEIAFISNRSGADDIYVISANGRNERNITNSPDAEAAVAWTNDGRPAFSIFKDGLSHF